MLDFEFFTQNGELLPSCYYPKLKQMICENTIKSYEVSPWDEGNPRFSREFLLSNRKCKHIDSSISAWDIYIYYWMPSSMWSPSMTM